MIAVAAAVALGALWRRVLGGFLHLPRDLTMLFGIAALMGLVIWAESPPGGLPFWDAVVAAWPMMAVVGAVFLNFSLGHGSYMDLGRMPNPDNEWLRKVLDLIWPEPPFSRKRDVLGLVLNYSVAPVVIVVVTGFWPALVVGPLVAAAYVVAHRYLGDKPTGISFVDGYTAVGELASGALLWGFAVAAFVNLGG